jgi:lysine-specific demethylase/histidyl-hydroxylase NO66
VNAIDRLVADLDQLRDSWERVPFVSRNLGDFADVFSVEEVQEILDRGVPLSAVRLFRGGRQIEPHSIARRRDPNARGREVYADPNKVLSAVGQGTTLVLEEVQSHSRTVAWFAADVARQTGHGTDCTAFVTPANHPGVRPHYDSTSIFVRQVHGEKRWRINAPPEPWPRHAWRAELPVDTAPVLHTVLTAGDCLYLPRGYIHAAEATDVASVHLTIGVDAPTWGEYLLGQLRIAMGDVESLRAGRPPAFAGGDPAVVFRERVADLALALDRLAYRAGPPPVRPAGDPRPELRTVLANGAVTPTGKSTPGAVDI